jgi:hypothetical protein
MDKQQISLFFWGFFPTAPLEENFFNVSQPKKGWMKQKSSYHMTLERNRIHFCTQIIKKGFKKDKKK